MVVKNTLAIAQANVKLLIQTTAITVPMFPTRTAVQNGGQTAQANAKRRQATQIVMPHH